MPNKNYINGKAKENRIKKKLQAEGWLVTRAAASKGNFDLIAVHKEFRRVRFIQVKPKKFSKKAEEKLLQEFAWLNDEFMCNFEVYTHNRKVYKPVIL